MEPAELRRIQNFIWNIADDVLRDIYSRGKYRDVILPMTVLRRIDALLAPTKAAVRALSQKLDKADALADPEREALYGNYIEAAAAEAPAKGRRKAKAQVWLTTFEHDPELRDTEQVPLQEAGGIEAFFKREVQPFAHDSWIEPDSTKIGYEISFARHFYRPKPLRTLKEIRDEILALERQTDGLLKKIVGAGARASFRPKARQKPQPRSPPLTWSTTSGD